MRTKGFIFDLDGVIVDTARYHYLAWKKLANTLGFDIDEAQNEKLKGVSRVKSLRIILEWGNMTLTEAEFQRCLALKNEDYLSYISTMTPADVLPGVSRIINYVLSKNQPIALGSASKNAGIILEKIGFLSLFNAIVDGNEVSKAKPHPEVFLIAAEKMKVNPKNCIVFEDAIAGIEAANAAGMISVGIGHKNVLHGADYIFRDFTAMQVDFIDKLLNHESELHHTK
ncbi:MAG: beta-phosphoglucomutase [Sinomicrobium sp.]|nr:beta-phosphoglucomutase [Sinomicrobium sp.]